MANIKYNNYQAYNDLWDTAYKYRNAVNNNGNLSAAQRAVMNYAGYKDAMDSMAKLNQYAQETNNKYGQAYALMAAQLGEDQADRDQKAAMFDYEAYNQAHGARRLMSSQRKADAMNYLNNWAKGLTDMHMWRDQMNMWQNEVDTKKAEQYLKAGLSPWGTKLAEKPTDVAMYNYINNIQPTLSQMEQDFRNSYIAHQPKKLGPILQYEADKKAYQDKIANLIAPSFPTLNELILVRKNINRRKSYKKK